MGRGRRPNDEAVIPATILDIYVRGVEAWLAAAADDTSRERLIVEGRTRFLRELLDDVKKREAEATP